MIIVLFNIYLQFLSYSLTTKLHGKVNAVFMTGENTNQLLKPFLRLGWVTGGSSTPHGYSRC